MYIVQIFGSNYADAVQHLAAKLGGIVVGASVVVGCATADAAAKCAAQYAIGVNA